MPLEPVTETGPARRRRAASLVKPRDISGSTVQCLTGLLCTLIGAQMLVVPHQLVSGAYDPVRPYASWWGAATLLTGIFMLMATAAGNARWLPYLANTTTGTILLLFASLWVAAGAWLVAAVVGALGLATLTASWVARAPRCTPGASDLLTLAVGGAAGLVGAGILAFPQHFTSPALDWLQPFQAAYGAGFLLAGGLTVVMQLGAEVRWWWRWLFALLLVGILLLPMLWRAVAVQAWTGMLLYGLGSLGLIVAPWLGPRLERVDPRSLHTRFAVTLGVLSALGLILVVTVDADREERSLRAEAGASQQTLAAALGHDVADYVEQHEAAVRTLAGGPGMLTRSPEEQTAWLQAYGDVYPSVVFAFFDATGQQTARSDGLPVSTLPTPDAPWLQRLRETAGPVRIVSRSTTRNRPIFGYMVPVFDGAGALSGIVGATVESSRLAEQLGQVVADPNQRAYLVDTQGRTISHPDLALVAAFADLSALQPVAALQATDAGTGSLVYTAGRDEWLAGYARVPGLGWGVVVEQPTSVALASVRAGRERAFLALIVVVSLATLAGALAAGWLTAPLAVLAVAVRRMTDGETDARLTTSNITEIAGLAGAFGEMRERLAARTLVLERSEAALRESEQRFRTMANSAPVLIWMTGVDGSCSFLNDGWLRFTGRTLEQELGTGWVRNVHPDDLARCLSTYQPSFAARQVYRMEYRLRRADGVYRWMADVGAPRFEPDGAFAGFIGSCIDITERREAEETSRLSEERLRLALQAGRMGTWDWNVQTNALSWDGSLEELHGLPVGSFDGRFETFLAVVHPDDRAVTMTAIQTALEQQSQFNTEFRVIWPDESVHWITGLGRAYADEQGTPARMVGIGLEITEQRRAVDVQRLLAEAVSRLVSSLDYETTLRSTVQLVATTMADYCIVQVQNDDGSQSVEVAHADAAQAEKVRQLLTDLPWPADDGTQPWVTALEDAPHELVQALGARSLIRVPLLARERTIGALTLIAAESGRRYGAADVGVAEALAARAALAVDNARLYSEAQAAIRARDEFLSIASHELRTPVTGIKGYAQLLLRAQEHQRLDDTRLARSLHAIDDASDRLATLTRDLLDVSRIRLGELPLRLQRIDFVELVRRVSERAADQLTDRHTLMVDVRTALPLIDADADRLEQVLTNLFDNAVKYSPTGGTVQIGLGLAGDDVVLTVQDDGIGLPGGAADAIFRPFGRAQNALQQHLPGMGLGLYICQNIVERHGGQITVESAGEGQGTTFRVVLPSRASETPPPTPGNAADGVDAGPLPVARRSKLPHRPRIVGPR